MYPANEFKTETHTGSNGGEMLGRPMCYFFSRRAGLGLTKILSEFSGIYIHRTRYGAQSIFGAGLFAVIHVCIFKFAQSFRILTRTPQARYLALYHGTLARRKGESAREAIDLAETAFDTLIHMVVRLGQML